MRVQCIVDTRDLPDFTKEALNLGLSILSVIKDVTDLMILRHVVLRTDAVCLSVS